LKDDIQECCLTQENPLVALWISAGPFTSKA
jgi:hypothetical protein